MTDIEAIWDIIEKYKTEKSNKSLSIQANKNEATVTIEKNALLNAGSNINSEVKLKSNSSETASTQEIACPDSNQVTQEKRKNNHPAEVSQTTDEQQKCGGNGKRKYLETENEFQPTEKKVKGELVKNQNLILMV